MSNDLKAMKAGYRERELEFRRNNGAPRGGQHVNKSRCPKARRRSGKNISY